MNTYCGLDFSQLSRTLWRRKNIKKCYDSKLIRVLSIFDLTFLGIGSTLGVGVYVIAGNVAKNYAGPAVVLSFLIAGIASILAGLCYAEFGARVPKAGSAYIYSYVTIGEFMAFLIGWNLILEYAIGSASVAKGLSTYLDSLFDNFMEKYLHDKLPINVNGFGDYPDLFAFFITILFALALAFGAKESSTLNNIFTGINLIVIGIVIIIGSFLITPHNWNLTINEIPLENYGLGGFMPYGFSGVIKGAAICFYGFIGFDCIATAGEETNNPHKTIPYAIILSLFIIFLAYFFISIILTMMLPYYDQNEDAPLPYAFHKHNIQLITLIITIGGIFGLFASLMGSMFALPRIILSMSEDGLLFECFSIINIKYHTPFIGTILSGLLIGILATIFNLNQLINMMSIGTLMAFTMVACCILILRYTKSFNNDKSEEEMLLLSSYQNVYDNEENQQQKQQSNDTSLVVLCVCIYCIGNFILSGFIASLNSYSNYFWNLKDFIIILIGLILLYLCLFVISLQPTYKYETLFNVPYVPWLPGISISINIYLMLMLGNMTWIRFGVWIIIGFLVYTMYSVRHSKLCEKNMIIS